MGDRATERGESQSQSSPKDLAGCSGALAGRHEIAGEHAIVVQHAIVVRHAIIGRRPTFGRGAMVERDAPVDCHLAASWTNPHGPLPLHATSLGPSAWARASLAASQRR